MKWNPKNLNDIEDLKLSNEMRLKKKKQKCDLSHLNNIKGIKGKAPSTPKTLDSKNKTWTPTQLLKKKKFGINPNIP
jgi:hypothetical protein